MGEKVAASWLPVYLELTLAGLPSYTKFGFEKLSQEMVVETRHDVFCVRRKGSVHSRDAVSGMRDEIRGVGLRKDNYPLILEGLLVN
ncbi:uncharacterized protein PADG_11050 [Paracoccidioides brasiliensis Pb18]|uniref:Uncharacterized protein n=1 Tax=Paracoccidioides brasiliensis (strain Pb18) TaxID=502780 RepID=A0A0A0HX04_PARBD|nr:uncharacterized protein PADG_11050 [Paracoccidioides brasiliensis Pb18]KGM92601.1 hypothetical protein PADG_11050 [Paracoccidioides brasiliensis Pb18]ODH51885.1 hypothetical protein GX48_01894 [Paracoccidioides brasiliensis]